MKSCRRFPVRQSMLYRHRAAQPTKLAPPTPTLPLAESLDPLSSRRPRSMAGGYRPTMNWSDPAIVAAAFGVGGTVLGTGVATAANLIVDRRREKREVLRDMHQARRDHDARTFEHRRAAYADFSQEVSSMANKVAYADLLHEWPGVDFDTFDHVYPKLEAVHFYGTPSIRARAEHLFEVLTKFCEMTVTSPKWPAFEEAQEAFRVVVREDLGIAGLQSSAQGPM